MAKMMTEASAVNFQSTEELKRLKLKSRMLFTEINSSGRNNIVEAVAFFERAPPRIREVQPSGQASLMTVFKQSDIEHPQQNRKVYHFRKKEERVSVGMNIKPTMSLVDSAHVNSQCLVFFSN
jgi:hypothetical protein